MVTPAPPLPKLHKPMLKTVRVSYIPNYKTAISDEITCWEGEQLHLSEDLKKKSFKPGYLRLEANIPDR